MKCVIEISTDNAAFEGEAMRGELQRILIKLADKIPFDMEMPVCSQVARDINGNTVGEMRFED